MGWGDFTTGLSHLFTNSSSSYDQKPTTTSIYWQYGTQQLNLADNATVDTWKTLQAFFDLNQGYCTFNCPAYTTTTCTETFSVGIAFPNLFIKQLDSVDAQGHLLPHGLVIPHPQPEQIDPTMRALVTQPWLCNPPGGLFAVQQEEVHHVKQNPLSWIGGHNEEDSYSENTNFFVEWRYLERVINKTSPQDLGFDDVDTGMRFQFHKWAIGNEQTQFLQDKSDAITMYDPNNPTITSTLQTGAAGSNDFCTPANIYRCFDDLSSTREKISTYACSFILEISCQFQLGGKGGNPVQMIPAFLACSENSELAKYCEHPDDKTQTLLRFILQDTDSQDKWNAINRLISDLTINNFRIPLDLTASLSTSANTIAEMMSVSFSIIFYTCNKGQAFFPTLNQNPPTSTTGDATIPTTPEEGVQFDLYLKGAIGGFNQATTADMIDWSTTVGSNTSSCISCTQASCDDVTQSTQLSDSTTNGSCAESAIGQAANYQSDQYRLVHNFIVSVAGALDGQTDVINTIQQTIAALQSTPGYNNKLQFTSDQQAVVVQFSNNLTNLNTTVQGIEILLKQDLNPSGDTKTYGVAYDAIKAGSIPCLPVDSGNAMLQIDQKVQAAYAQLKTIFAGLSAALANVKGLDATIHGISDPDFTGGTFDLGTALSSISTVFNTLNTLMATETDRASAATDGQNLPPSATPVTPVASPSSPPVVAKGGLPHWAVPVISVVVAILAIFVLMYVYRRYNSSPS